MTYPHQVSGLEDEHTNLVNSLWTRPEVENPQFESLLHMISGV
jgi:hypothetical protein